MSKCQVVEDMGFFLVSSINYFIVVRRMLNVCHAISPDFYEDVSIMFCFVDVDVHLSSIFCSAVRTI